MLTTRFAIIRLQARIIHDFPADENGAIAMAECPPLAIARKLLLILPSLPPARPAVKNFFLL